VPSASRCREQGKGIVDDGDGEGGRRAAISYFVNPGRGFLRPQQSSTADCRMAAAQCAVLRSARCVDCRLWTPTSGQWACPLLATGNWQRHWQLATQLATTGYWLLGSGPGSGLWAAGCRCTTHHHRSIYFCVSAYRHLKPRALPSTCNSMNDTFRCRYYALPLPRLRLPIASHAWLLAPKCEPLLHPSPPTPPTPTL
jgi:hypothetical protein